MVQKYMSAVDDHGETGMVFVGGVFSHAFRKQAILASAVEWEAGLFAREQVAGTIPSPEERALGELVVATLPPTAYARVDLLPTDEGPVLLELEVVEPSLFLHLDPAAPARAAAVFRNLMP
jgi:glutathione synthase/RimK-type ligase-like ATP-grasp enzyme